MKIITLRLYKGKETYNKEGKLTSTNQLYKISHNTFDWEAFKKTIAFTFSRAEVLEVNEQIVKMEEEEVLGKKVPVARYSYVKKEVTEELKREIDVIFNGEEKKMTPQEEKIANLEAVVKELQKNSKPKEDKDIQSDGKEDLEKARKEYMDAFEGKKPFHGWDADTLRNKITDKS